MPPHEAERSGKRRVIPYNQGDLDYLCAVYAIINAVRALCPEVNEDISTSLFRLLVRSLGKHSQNVVLPFVSGTDGSLLRKLLGKAVAYLSKRIGVELTCEPLRAALRSSTIAIAWDRLTAALDDTTVIILPLGGCCNHWTVVFDVKPDKIRLIDSNERRSLPRGRCTLNPTVKRYRLEFDGAIGLRRRDP